MSRRAPNPAADRAAENQKTIKSILKLESNKTCADCKRNKHPRWASWNLGVFICIRCSGIHRSMGVHISRVKSVDLDSWTDEQLQSVLSWGNARANKYWEAKLAEGHVPSESKIENFIRTKYELKRWAMDGEIPDPSTLDVEGDDDIPLSVVKEKQNMQWRESVRKAPAAVPQMDLIGGDPIPRRTSNALPNQSPAVTKVTAKAEAAPPKTSTKDSLLGLEFFGGVPTGPPRPASTSGALGAGGQSRPDLKQSILSLYATAPRSQPQGSLSGMSSPSAKSQESNMYGEMQNAFSSLSFGDGDRAAIKSPLPSKDTFAGLGVYTSPRPTHLGNTYSFSNLSGGSFFDVKPAATSQPRPAPGRMSGLGGFTSPMLSPAPDCQAPKQSASASLGDLFDFSSPTSAAPAPAAASVNTTSLPAASTPANSAVNSVFNLSANQAKSPGVATTSNTSALGSSAWSNSDVWGGSSNAWATAEPPKKAEQAKACTAGNDFGLGGAGSSLASQPIVPGISGGFAPAPRVAEDEDFGGWTSSSAPSVGNSTTSKPAVGFGGSDDLFSNVWQ